MKNGGGGTLRSVFKKSNGGLFERVGADRFPIKQKYGPSTGHMMQNEKVIENMDKLIGETFEKRMEHEITRLLNGW